MTAYDSPSQPTLTYPRHQVRYLPANAVMVHGTSLNEEADRRPSYSHNSQPHGEEQEGGGRLIWVVGITPLWDLLAPGRRQWK